MKRKDKSEGGKRRRDLGNFAGLGLLDEGLVVQHSDAIGDGSGSFVSLEEADDDRSQQEGFLIGLSGGGGCSL